LALVSCGKSESGAQPIARADFPARTAHLVCESLAACCKTSGFPLDLADCEAAQVPRLELQLEQEANARVRYDPQAAGDCIEGALSRIQCGDIDSDGNPACRHLFAGDVGLGEPCDNSYECALVDGRSVSCQNSDGMSPAVCTAIMKPQHGKAGDACIGTCVPGGDCSATPTRPDGTPDLQAAVVLCYRAESLFCHLGRCSPLLALGEACDDYAACHDGTFCNSDTQLCDTPRADGSRCEDDNQCQSDRCREPPSDDPDQASGVCVSPTTVSATRCEGATQPLPDNTGPGGGPIDPESGGDTP